MSDEVTQLRLVVTVPDFDAALAFYRDELGLPEEAAFSGDGTRVSILRAGRATLELADVGHAAFVDEVEVGRRVAGQVRVAFEVIDSGGSPTGWPAPAPPWWHRRPSRRGSP